MAIRFLGKLVFLLLISFQLEAAEETPVPVVNPELAAAGMDECVVDTVEVYEKFWYDKSKLTGDVTRITPDADIPAPTCEPLKFANYPEFSNPFLSKTFSLFVADIIKAMTPLINTDQFQGTLAPLTSDQKDLSEFSFNLKDIQTESISTPGMGGEKLKITSNVYLRTTQYREAHTIRYLGGKQYNFQGEIKFAIRVGAQIETTETILNYINKDIVSKCDERINQQLPSGLFASTPSESLKSWVEMQKKICKTMDSSKYTGTPAERAFQMLTAWKKALMEELASYYAKNPTDFISPYCEEIKDMVGKPQFSQIKTKLQAMESLYCADAYEEVRAALDQSLRVEKNGDKVNFSLHIAQVNKQLGNRFPNFFNKFKLDTVTVNRFLMTIGNTQSDVAFDIVLKQPMERHGLISMMVSSLASVSSDWEAENKANEMTLGVLALLGPKLPGLFPDHSGRIDRIQNGAGAAWKKGLGEASNSVEATTDAVVDGGKAIIDGALNLFGGSDEDED